MWCYHRLPYVKKAQTPVKEHTSHRVRHFPRVAHPRHRIAKITAKTAFLLLRLAHHSKLFCSLFNFPHTTTSLSSAFSSFCTTTSSITAPSALTRFVLFCIFQVPRTAPCCGLLLRFFFFSARFFFGCLRRLWRFGLYSPAPLQLHRLCVAFFFSASVAAACAGCGVSAYKAPLLCNCMPLRCSFAVSL
jgi:hypothetical protein